MDGHPHRKRSEAVAVCLMVSARYGPRAEAVALLGPGGNLVPSVGGVSLITYDACDSFALCYRDEHLRCIGHSADRRNISVHLRPNHRPKTCVDVAM